jgi:hypothetical protein
VFTTYESREVPSTEEERTRALDQLDAALARTDKVFARLMIKADA